MALFFAAQIQPLSVDALGRAIAQGLFYAFWLLPLGWMLGALEHQSSQKINGMLGARLVAVGLVGGWLLLLRPAQPFPWHLWLWGWGMLEGGRWRYHASLARESRCRS
ncbi:MAG: hypothetical protein HC857_02690 [Synechococcales cyanobacterium RU_4_20]|nr:hypothetical protein [Synechococcales cyanobacterium RU_4_20]